MLEQLGLFGLFLGCMLSATVVPFASEALLAGALLMGYGKWAVTLVAALGNTTGGMISYLMGWLCKWEWLEKYFRVKREKLERSPLSCCNGPAGVYLLVLVLFYVPSQKFPLKGAFVMIITEYLT